MREYGRILERVERRVRMPEPAMERLLRRRDRRLRNQRIAAAAVGLVVAVAGIGFGVLALRGREAGQPASGVGPSPGPADDGILGIVLPTVAIWIALAVLGLSMLAFVRLRRSARPSAPRPTPGAPPGRRPTEPRGPEGRGPSATVARAPTGVPQVEAPEPEAVEARPSRLKQWRGIAVILVVTGIVATGFALFARYTTSGKVMARARVTFDGSTCAYSGPAQVAAGTRIAFDYTAAEGLESAMVLIRLPPGMTYEDMVQVATRDADNPPSWAVPNWESEPKGAPRQSLTMSLGEGLWAIVCGTSPETTNDIVMGTILRAVGGPSKAEIEERLIQEFLDLGRGDLANVVRTEAFEPAPAEVVRALDASTAALNAGDAVALGDGFTEDAVVTDTIAGMELEGTDEIVDFYTEPEGYWQLERVGAVFEVGDLSAYAFTYRLGSGILALRLDDDLKIAHQWILGA